jgi:hypothetical protein
MKLYIVIYHGRVALVSESETDASEYARELAETLTYPVFNQGDAWFPCNVLAGTLADIYIAERILDEKHIKL